MAEQPAVTTRRREVGSASARSLLLTVLGEFVHPRAEPVWTATLLEALGALGVEEKSARQALTRTSSEHLLTSTRHGRRVLWELTPDGARLLEEGTRRIYGFMRERHPWDGRWLVLSVPIPETQRQLRHRLRTRLTWLGLGSPTSGLWVTPDDTKAAEVHAVVRDLGLETQAFAWVGPASGIGDESRLLADAWDLAEVEDRYLALPGRLRGPARRHPRGGVRRAGRDGPGVAALPVPRPRPSRRAARPRLARPPGGRGVPRPARRLAPAGAGRVGPDGPRRRPEALADC